MSFTSRSSLTGCFGASSRWAPTWASRKSPTRKRSARRPIKAEGKFIKQTGGRGQYGHVVARGHHRANPRKACGFVFENKIVRRFVVPREYINPLFEQPA